MTVTKTNGFAAPYRSQTFQRQASALTQKNGILAMSGVVSQVGPTITVPAFTFIQDGLIVKKDVPTNITASSIVAPFFLTVTTPTSQNIDDLTFQFAKTPVDIVSTEVLIAEYDGNEWRVFPFLSSGEIIADLQQDNVERNRLGPVTGLTTSVSGPDYLNVGGTLIDKNGLRRTLIEDQLFPIITADPELTFSRVDRIIYRRPQDYPDKRIGVRKFQLGGTYTTGTQVINETSPFGTATPTVSLKSLIHSDNTAFLWAVTGYGDQFKIRKAKYSADRTTQTIAPADVVTTLTQSKIAVAVENAGTNRMFLAYVSGDDLLVSRTDSSGVVSVGPVVIDTQVDGEIGDPSITVDPYNNRLFIVYRKLLGPSNNQIFVAIRDLSLNVIVSPKNLTNNSNDLATPDVFVSDDLWVYVAWADQSTTQVRFRIFDEAGDTMTGFIETQVSGATNQIGFGTLVDDAVDPRILVTDNKTVMVAFRQDKGGSLFGLSVWQDGTASMVDFTGSDDFSDYEFFADDINNDWHFITINGSNVDYTKISALAIILQISLSTSGAQSVSLVQDKTGSLLQTWTEAASGTFTSYDAGNTVSKIGPGVFISTLAANEMSVLIAALPTAPRVGDRFVNTGSVSGNNGTFLITGVRVGSISALNDSYIIAKSGAFTAPEASPPGSVVADFQSPDGNDATFAKSVAEAPDKAFRMDELPSDTLLARIGQPGPVILNYPPGGASSLLESSQFMPFGDDVEIDWSLTTVDEVTITGGLMILDLVNNLTYSLTDGGYALDADGKALYVVLDGVNLSPTPQIAAVEFLPYGSPIQVLGVRKFGAFHPHFLGKGMMDKLDSGETIIFGEELDQNDRARLGLNPQTGYEAYTSTTNISAGQSYPAALSTLDDAVNQIQINTPKEQHFTANGTDTLFNLTLFTIDPDNTKYDITVTVDGRKQVQDTTGLLLSKNYRKNSSTQIEFIVAPKLDAEITVRREGTATGGGDQVGTTVDNPADFIYLLDQDDLTTVWKLFFNNGVLDYESV